MFARITTFEVDTVRIGLREALERFKELVMPQLRQQAGFQGILVLETPEGKGLLVSLWETEDAAKVSLESGFYDEQISKLVTILRQPPGREHYEVVYSETLPGILSKAS